MGHNLVKYQTSAEILARFNRFICIAKFTRVLFSLRNDPIFTNNSTINDQTAARDTEQKFMLEVRWLWINYDSTAACYFFLTAHRFYISPILIRLFNYMQ